MATYPQSDTLDLLPEKLIPPLLHCSQPQPLPQQEDEEHGEGK
jgi:hypothetical protein